jgi:asparagine synthase (glutamine-hydrolysing)
MVEALRHRGPDDQGIKPLAAAVLGHTRLSIIDLTSGHQPLSTADDRYWITFNGEIYNYLPLREELSRAGYRFRTTSDTEVLLAAYQTWDIAAFDRLNGMYAFAIWDNETRRLVALRDRTGKKPFYYCTLADGSLLFASEVKALLKSGLVERRVDMAMVDAYLALGYVPPDRTIFRDIKVLPPASHLTWRAGELKSGSYWRPDLVASESITETEAVEELRRLVDAAVARRMIADVPVGAFLSGGLDSTTVVTLMSRRSAAPVKTFSVGFGNLINELPYAGAVARQLNTEHHEIQVDLEVGELVDRMAGIFDEPLADSSSIPTYVVSRFAAENVKVVLTGDGGDELFAGYEWWYRPLVKSEQLPTSRLAYNLLRVAIRGAVIANRMALPVGGTVTQLWERRRLHEMAAEHPDLWARQRANVTRFPAALRRTLWASKFQDLVREPPATACPSDVTGLNRALWFDISMYLPGDILVKVDRAAMAVGLEARCPLLDPELITFALKLPTSLKLNGNEGKYIFKRAFTDLWPEEIKRRRKHGFGAPEAAWLRRDDVRAIVERVVTGANSPLGDWFDLQEVRSRVKPHYSEQRGFSSAQMWSLLTLGLWRERWAAGA